MVLRSNARTSRRLKPRQFDSTTSVASHDSLPCDSFKDATPRAPLHRLDDIEFHVDCPQSNATRSRPRLDCTRRATKRNPAPPNVTTLPRRSNEQQAIDDVNMSNSIPSAWPEAFCASSGLAATHSLDAGPYDPLGRPAPFDNDREGPLATPTTPWKPRSPHATDRTCPTLGTETNPRRPDVNGFPEHMQQVFTRINDMVDVHRSLFTSDGTASDRQALAAHAEDVAKEAFEHLARLRTRFTWLANEVPLVECVNELSMTRDNLARKGTEAAWEKQRPLVASNQDEHDAKDTRPRLSHVSVSRNERAERGMKSRRSREDCCQSVTDWPAHCQRDAIVTANSIGSVDDASSRTTRYSKGDPTDTDTIFRELDQRMEQIRCALHAIVHGTKTRRGSSSSSSDASGAALSRHFTDSPMSAMMDATRTKSTLRRKSSQLNDDIDDDNRPQPSGREIEMHQLLKTLNHSDEADD